MGAVHWLKNMELKQTVPYENEKFVHTEEMEVLLKVLKHYNPKFETFMNLYCHDGFIGKRLLKEFEQSFGLFMDPSYTHIENVHHHLHDYISRSSIVRGNLNESLYKTAAPQSLDVIVTNCRNEQHVTRIGEKTYEEIFHLLQDGGVYLEVTRLENSKSYQQTSVVSLQGQNVQAYSRTIALNEALVALEQAGFTEVECFYKSLDQVIIGGIKARTKH